MYDIHKEQTHYIFENLFRLMSKYVNPFSFYNKNCYKNNILQAISDSYCGKLVNKDHYYKSTMKSIFYSIQTKITVVTLK